MKTLVIEIITCILLLNFANIALAAEVNLPPKKIILHNTLDGELDKNPLSCGVKSKIKMKLYEYPEESSAIITELPANQYAQIKGYELHTYPFENVYSTGGQEVYFLSYMGEGRYSVFLDGKVSIIRTETNKIKTNAEFWLCVASPINGLEGWTKFNKINDWYTEIGSGIFLTKNKSNLWE